MNVSLLSIDLPSSSDGPVRGEPFEVRVRLNEAGSEHSYTLSVRPPPIPGLGAELITAEQALRDRFRNDQRTLSQLCRLVGQAIRTGSVHLPHRLAA